jgi:hypothetical protein
MATVLLVSLCTSGAALARTGPARLGPPPDTLRFPYTGGGRLPGEARARFPFRGRAAQRGIGDEHLARHPVLVLDGRNHARLVEGGGPADRGVGHRWPPGVHPHRDGAVASTHQKPVGEGYQFDADGRLLGTATDGSGLPSNRTLAQMLPAQEEPEPSCWAAPAAFRAFSRRGSTSSSTG